MQAMTKIKLGQRRIMIKSLINKCRIFYNILFCSRIFCSNVFLTFLFFHRTYYYNCKL